MPIKLEDFKQSNMLVTVLVIGLVLLLLFIPDILGVKAPLIDRAADLPQSWLSYRDGKVGRTGAGKSVLESENASNTERGSGAGDRQRRELRLAGGIGADNLNDSKSLAKLAQVRATSQQLAFALPREFGASRFTLLNLIGGIDRVTGAEARSMSTPESIKYLNGLDIAVSRALEQEQVPVEYLSVWQSNSLEGEPYSESNVTRQDKPENPANQFGFVLKRITYFRYSNQKGEYDESAPLFVDIDFVTVGKDASLIKRASLFKGKTIRRRTNLSPEMSEFSYTALPVSEQYAVEVKTRDGRQLKRGFSFAVSGSGFEHRYDPARKIYLVNIPLTKRSSVASAADATTWFGARSGNSGTSPLKSLFSNGRSQVSQF
jgi:hypothetical protein